MRVASRKNDDGYFVTSWGATSHFHESELACKDGCGLKDMSQDFLDGLERLRMRLAAPIIIESGVRCAEHNKEVGGAAKSQHLPDDAGIGDAADIRSPGISSGWLYLLSLGIEQFHGRGLRSTTLHVDARPGQEASWMYDQHAGQKPELWIAGLIEKAFKEA